MRRKDAPPPLHPPPSREVGLSGAPALRFCPTPPVDIPAYVLNNNDTNHKATNNS